METYVPRTIEQMHAIQQKHAAAAAVAASASSSSTSSANGKTLTGAAAAVAAQTEAAAQAAAAASRKRRANAAAAVRADGRQNTQLRSTFLQVGVVSAAVGSSYVERQGTKVLCAIYGPRASSKVSSTPFSERRGAFLCDVRFAPFAGSGGRRTRRGAQASEEEKNLSLRLVEALTVCIHLESFPKAVLEAFVVVLQEEGASSVFPAAVCALSLGLAQAGIMMYDLVAGCAALSTEGRTLLDPSAEEEAEWAEASAAAASAADHSDASSPPAASCASVSLAYLPSLRQISSVTQAGSAPVGEVSKLTHMCIAGCEQLQGLMKECLMEDAKKKSGQPAAAAAAAAATATR